MVRRTAPAEGKSVIRCALAVDEEVATIGECRSLVQADRVPHILPEWLGGDHEGVDGCDRALVPRQARGVSLCSAHHVTCAHATAWGAHQPGTHLRDGRVLVDNPASLDDGLRELAHQAGGMDRGAMRGVRRADDIGGREKATGLLGIEESVVLLAESPATPLSDLLLGALPLQGSARGDNGAALGPLNVPAFGLRDAPNVVDGVVHRALQADGTLAVAHARDLGHARGEERGAPAAIAPTGSESRVLGLQHGHANARLLGEQVVGGPQAGVARAHDDDVGLGVTIEGLTQGCREVLGKRVPPQRCHPRRQVRT